MKEFSLARKINFAVSQPVVKPREVTVDPDRPRFDYLKSTELPINTQFVMRALPSDKEKNPLGYIVKEMYQFPDELDLDSPGWKARHKCRFKMVPGCYKPDADDYMLKIYKKIEALLDGPTNMDFIPDPDPAKAAKGEGTLVLKDGADGPTRADEFRALVNDKNNPFCTFLQVISKKWTQVIIPVLIYATADVKMDGKYERSSNYQPDGDMETYLPRLIQFNLTKQLETGLLEHFVEKTGSPAINDLVKGKDILYTRTDKGHVFALAPKRSALDEDFANKLASNPEYYPNLRERELSKSFEPDTLEAALKACPKKYLQPLIDFGILDSE